jgi:hypothetical protein
LKKPIEGMFDNLRGRGYYFLPNKSFDRAGCRDLHPGAGRSSAREDVHHGRSVPTRLLR